MKTGNRRNFLMRWALLALTLVAIVVPASQAATPATLHADLSEWRFEQAVAKANSRGPAVLATDVKIVADGNAPAVPGAVAFPSILHNPDVGLPAAPALGVPPEGIVPTVGFPTTTDPSVPAGDGFSWRDAAIGFGVAAVLALFAAGMVMIFRNRGRVAAGMS